MGSQDNIQMLRLGGTCLFPLSHLALSLIFFSFYIIVAINRSKENYKYLLVTDNCYVFEVAKLYLILYLLLTYV